MTDLHRLSAHELLAGYAAAAFSPRDVVEAAARRIERVGPEVDAFSALCLERAAAEARAAESAWRKGTAGPLEGVPLAVKDLFDTEGVETAYGSALYAGHVPAADAEAVRRARAAGAIVVGKTRTHEFAWGITTVHETLGSARNPWDRDRIAGGSSGGSAAALAADAVPLALGSDTGGSIRIPAAFCGVVGLKPTFGRVSLAGIFPLAPSLDHAGPMARTPADAALLLAAIAGADEADPATVLGPQPPAAAELAAEFALGAAGLTVGVCPDALVSPLSAAVSETLAGAAAALEAAGARLVEVPFPEAGIVYGAFGRVQRAEALDVHTRAGLFPARAAEYGSDVRARLESAREVTLADHLAGRRDRVRVRAGFARLHRSCDVLLTPVSTGPPPRIGDDAGLRDSVMPLTTPQDMAGLPACALRAGFDELGLPIAVQLTGRPWAEALVLRAAHALFEATAECQERRPLLAGTV